MSEGQFQDEINKIKEQIDAQRADSEETERLTNETKDLINIENEARTREGDTRDASVKRKELLRNLGTRSGFGSQEVEGERKERGRRIILPDSNQEQDTHYVETHYQVPLRNKISVIKEKVDETRENAINSLFREGGLLFKKMNAGEDITWKSIEGEIEHSLQGYFSHEISMFNRAYADEMVKLIADKEKVESYLENLNQEKEEIERNRRRGLGNMVEDVESKVLEDINESIRQNTIKRERISRKIRYVKNDMEDLAEQAGKKMKLKKREKQYIQRELQEYAREKDPAADPFAQAQWRNKLTGRRRGLQEGELGALFDNFSGEKKKSGGRKKKTRRMKKKNKRKTRRRKKRKKTRRRKKGGRRKTRRCVKL